MIFFLILFKKKDIVTGKNKKELFYYFIISPSQYWYPGCIYETSYIDQGFLI